MAKYAFFSFPGYGHVNPTLAIVQELIAHGEEVIYYLTSQFRETIEATGATFQAYEFKLSSDEHTPPTSPTPGDMRISMLPMLMVQRSTERVPRLLEMVRTEQIDCVVYDSMFFWASVIARILHIPAVALRPSYAVNEQSSVFTRFAQRFPISSEAITVLNNKLAELSAMYSIPPLNMASVFMNPEALIIVFLPRAFQPAGETFDEHVVFIGPSLQSVRHEQGDFPFEQLDSLHPILYISLGTVFNDHADFYNMCFAAFGNTNWQVILSLGSRVDRAKLQTIPPNFLVASYVPQLEMLSRASIFLSHGGMNSTMESLYYGVPLVVIPQMMEQEITAQRVQELGLGLALDRTTVTTDALREAVEQVAHNPTFRTQAQAMQQKIHEAGGYQRATDAIMQFARTHQA